MNIEARWDLAPYCFARPRDDTPSVPREIWVMNTFRWFDDFHPMRPIQGVTLIPSCHYDASYVVDTKKIPTPEFMRDLGSLPCKMALKTEKP